MKFYGVVGEPVLHSKSPTFFNPIFRELGLDAYYTRIAAESINDAMYLFDALGFDGMNITTPFKNDAINVCDELNEIAKNIGAVNTILNWDGIKVGFNTDYLGVLNALKKNKVTLKHKKVLLLGGGNAAKAVLYAIKNCECEVVMVNRASDKARRLAEKFEAKFETIQNLPNIIGNFDLLISTLPNEYITIKKEWFTNPDLIIFDANYSKSKFAEIAKQLKLKYISGLEWLVNQAIPALKTFTGETLEYNSKMSKSLAGSSRNPKANIYLIGFMGSGKTTIGQLLAEKMGKEFYDIDDLIIARQGKSIYDIFNDHGEAYFRAVETEILREMSEKEGVIVSCGGGIILSEENRTTIKNNSFVIWLYSELNTCINRMKLKTRPLLAVENPFQIAKLIMNQRRKLYFTCSDLVVNSERPAAKVMERIYDEFRKSGYYD